ncbi:alpha/beta hydrolase [Neobacillus dielmonensis]|uniref:alpha/beta hydrolase n=1 Tax=Neobacillus dielmonensis TaxID=1347369 RepID=UPI0005AAAE50|nr:alpha/beta hydrolase-fold protein [Neobacillus dielmonensis]
MEIPKGSLKEISFHSNELSEELQLLIYLPANYSPLYKYSILIAQDGLDYFQLGRIGRIADEYLFNNEIENLIIVGVPYKDVEERRKKYHPSGASNQKYIRFLAHELVPFLDGEYPTYQIGSTRALIGDSLAATVSFMATLQYPNTFGKVIMQSPYVNHTIIQLAANFLKNLGLEIYHVVGTLETKVPMGNGGTSDFLTPNRELSKILATKPFTYFYEEFPGDHTWTYWQPDLRRAIKRAFQN